VRPTELVINKTKMKGLLAFTLSLCTLIPHVERSAIRRDLSSTDFWLRKFVDRRTGKWEQRERSYLGYFPAGNGSNCMREFFGGWKFLAGGKGVVCGFFSTFDNFMTEQIDADTVERANLRNDIGRNIDGA